MEIQDFNLLSIGAISSIIMIWLLEMKIWFCEMIGPMDERLK
jgi:hypothetical protein